MKDQFPRLETERLILRKPRLSDAEDVYEYMRHGTVQTYIPNAPLQYTKENAQSYVENSIESFDPTQKIVWAIQHKQDNKVIGMVNIHNIKPTHRRGVLGYALSPEYQRKGHMTETLKKIIAYAFQKKNFHRLEAETAEENKPSRNLLSSKLSFQQEGQHKDRLDIRGDYHNTVSYALIRTRWDHG